MIRVTEETYTDAEKIKDLALIKATMVNAYNFIQSINTRVQPTQALDLSLAIDKLDRIIDGFDGTVKYMVENDV